MTHLAGCAALVTGGGRGLGAAIALALAEAGAAVALLARESCEVVTVAEMIRAKGGQALGIAADVADVTAVHAAVEEAREMLGPLTILINNAAITGPLARIADADPAQWAYALAVNLNGPFYLAQAILPDMLAAGWGRIINISSGAAVGANSGLGAYSVSKAGLDHFTRLLDAEYHAVGIAAMTIYPGIMATDMQTQARAYDIPETEMFREYHARGWLRSPDESAALARWLCGPEGADFHGQGVNIHSSAIRAKLGLPELPVELQRP